MLRHDPVQEQGDPPKQKCSSFSLSLELLSLPPFLCSIKSDIFIKASCASYPVVLAGPLVTQQLVDNLCADRISEKIAHHLKTYLMR